MSIGTPGNEAAASAVEGFNDKSATVETLHRMASVDRYNDWIFAKLSRHIGSRILEVGSGIGSMTRYFLSANDGKVEVTCLDVEDDSVAYVQKRFAVDPRIQVVVGDITNPDLIVNLGKAYDGRAFDTIVCINVLEHINDDALALRHMRSVLAPGGKLLLFVPAGMYLFGELDRAVGHYRRYSLEPIRKLIQEQGLQVEESFYMNVAGIPGWFLSSRILRQKFPPRGLLSLFNLLAPIFIAFEERLRPNFGQSIVVVAKRIE